MERAPDPDGLAAYLSVLREGGIAAAREITESLLRSDEYQARFPGKAPTIGITSPELDPAAETYSDQLQQAHLDTASYASARLLEFGTSEFSRLYRRFFPNLTLDLADRPVPDDYVGFTRERASALTQCHAYYTIDLEAPATAFRLAGLETGTYDIVVMAEVLEHLLVDPVALFGEVLRLLKPAGHLYLTTPNYFSARNIDRLERGVNPQDIYPGHDRNWDAHYHHREYGVQEILGFIAEARGHLRGFYFSACWDKETHAVAERGNIVFVIGPEAESASSPGPSPGPLTCLPAERTMTPHA